MKPGFEVDNPAGPSRGPRLDARPRAGTCSTARAPASRCASRPATTLTSLTAYRKLDYDVLADTDITELDLAASHVHEIQHQWSEEVTVSGRRPGLSWVGGLFLLEDDDRQPTSSAWGDRASRTASTPGSRHPRGALFGQATISLTRSLSATAGLRYTRERKTIENAGGLYPLDQPEVSVPGSTYAYTDAISHAAWTPKLGLELQRRGADARLRLRDARLQERRLQHHRRRSRARVRSGVGVELRGRPQEHLRRWARSAQRRRLPHRLHDLQVQTAIRPGVLDISNAAAAAIRGVEMEGPGSPRALCSSGGTWPGWTPATTSTSRSGWAA